VKKPLEFPAPTFSPPSSLCVAGVARLQSHHMTVLGVPRGLAQEGLRKGVETRVPRTHRG